MKYILPFTLISGTYPHCKNCKHFIAPSYEAPKLNKNYFPMNLSYGRCGRFGIVDIKDGSLIYSYAKYIRNNECKKAKYFEEK